MGRKRKGRTTTVRVRLVDLPRLKAIARSFNMSLPDYLSMIARRKKLK
jgi:hypothetical protein